MINKIKFLTKKIKELKDIQNELENEFGRKFTLDGHLVGSLTEIYAQEKYNLTLCKNQSKKYIDAYKDNKGIQIKGTQLEKDIILKGPTDILLVLKITDESNFEEIYNGDFKSVWKLCNNKNEYKTIRVSKLKELNKKIDNLL